METLEREAREADAVLHLAFIHDFNNYDKSIEIDGEVIRAYHRALKGTNKPVIGIIIHLLLIITILI